MPQGRAFQNQGTALKAPEGHLMSESMPHTALPQTVVFAGPSISKEEITRILPGAEVKPPVRRGDAAAAAQDGARLIVIIDGVFFQDEAVAHKELLGVLKAGVKVFGASSMGALRACELEPFGMTGIGKIFEWYRSGKIVADDEVGMLFDPETGAALSVPMVNMRASFEKAKEAGVLTADEERALLKACKGIYYPERTYRRVVKEADVSAETKDTLTRWLKTDAVDQKHEDAAACLAHVRGLYD